SSAASAPAARWRAHCVSLRRGPAALSSLSSAIAATAISRPASTVNLSAKRPGCACLVLPGRFCL
ncbi:hypothetical protein, partial [Pantoea septica]|uniref:hypothetical protein n=1 Tax=Pantoea septica TaxID=472695 RepID=UPI003917BDC2